MHSTRMRTALLLTISHNIPRWGGATQPPWMQTPPHLWMQTLPVGRPPGGRPSGHVTCDACWEANPPPCEQNDTRV